MKRFQININNASCEVLINTYSQRRYSEKVGVAEVNKTISGLLEGVRVDENQMAHFTWEAYDRFAIFIYEGIVEAARCDKKELTVTLEDVYQIFESIEDFSKVFTIIFGTLPVSDEKQTAEGEPSGNPQSPPTAD